MNQTLKNNNNIRLYLWAAGLIISGLIMLFGFVKLTSVDIAINAEKIKNLQNYDTEHKKTLENISRKIEKLQDDLRESELRLIREIRNNK